MKILVTGSDGLIGKNIIPLLSQRFEIIRTTEMEWNIVDRSLGDQIMRRLRPDVLLNLAAVTDVDGCEVDPDRALSVNAEGAAVLASLTKEYGAKLVHLSSDYVFDGKKGAPYTEEDAVNPLSVYGMTKSLGEQAVLAGNSSALVIRTEWVYGEGGQNFITKVLAAGCDRGWVDVVDDQTGSPTYAPDLAAPITKLIGRRACGIYHVTNSGACTWFQFARAVFSALGVDVRVRAIDSASAHRKAIRPLYSVFDLSKLACHTGIRMRGWQEALAEYLARVFRSFGSREQAMLEGGRV